MDDSSPRACNSINQREQSHSTVMPLFGYQQTKGGNRIRTYLYREAGFMEKTQWLPNSWVSVVYPGSSDFKFLTETLKAPESFLNDIADTGKRLRTEAEGNWLLAILRIPVQNTQSSLPYIAVPIGIIANNEVIVSVYYHQTDMIPDFIEHAHRKEIKVHNKLDLIFRLIYSSAVWLLKYLKQINVNTTAAEKELERNIRNEDLLRSMKLQKALVYFNISIRGNEAIIDKLKTIFRDADFLDEELVEDVIIELRQVFNMVNIYSNILIGTTDTFASIIPNNVNTITKHMTDLPITSMTPTLIASFCGMNVDVHLEGMLHAFMLITSISVLSSALSFVIFRKIKWF